MGGKPASDIYEIAAEKLNLKPEECIVVEDALSGIDAAKNAGIGRIIAIASMDGKDVYKDIPCVTQVITTFDEFDRNMFAQNVTC